MLSCSPDVADGARMVVELGRLVERRDTGLARAVVDADLGQVPLSRCYPLLEHGSG